MKRGYALYVDVLVALKRQPRTAARLCVVLGDPIAVEKLRGVLRRLLDAEVLRVVRWQKTGGNWERVFGLANGHPSIPHPAGRWVRPLRPTQHVARFAAIWHSLADECSAADIVELHGASVWDARKLLQRLFVAGLLGVSYICDGKHRTALYERDAEVEPWPVRQTVQERSARKRERRRVKRLHQIFTFSAPRPGA